MDVAAKSQDVPWSRTVFSEMRGLNDDTRGREDSPSGMWVRQHQSLQCSFNHIMGLKPLAVATASPQVALSGEDFVPLRTLVGGVP